MSNTWFTSDLHLGHANIIKYCNRPFDSVQEMNEQIVKRWNSIVEPLDAVYVLGDLALGKLDESLAVAAQLNGEKLLVPGNHDRCWQGHKRVRIRDVSRYSDAGFIVLPGEVKHTMDRDGFEVLLCHFPYTGDSQGDDRYAEHRPIDEGSVLVHGHTHSLEKLNRPRQVHVGMDAWDFEPVNEHVVRTAAEMVRHDGL